MKFLVKIRFGGGHKSLCVLACEIMEEERMIDRYTKEQRWKKETDGCIVVHYCTFRLASALSGRARTTYSPCRLFSLLHPLTKSRMITMLILDGNSEIGAHVYVVCSDQIECIHKSYFFLAKAHFP